MEHPEQRGNKGKTRFLLGEALLLLVLVPMAALLLLYHWVRPLVIWELNNQCPPVSACLRTGDGRYVSPVETVDWTKPGLHLAVVEAEGRERLVCLLVRDTVAPEAQAVPLVLGVDETATADRFLANVSDRQRVAVSFEKAPVFHVAGEYEVVIRLADDSGNVSRLSTTATILGAVPQISVEAGEPVPPVEQFLPNEGLIGRFLTDVSAIDTGVPGAVPVRVEVNGEEYETVLLVQDTEAPLCTFASAAYGRPGEALPPEALVEAVQDATPLSYRYLVEPDWSQWGYQTAVVAVTDAGGNTATGETTVLISPLEPLRWEASRRRLTASELQQRQQALQEDFSGELRVAYYLPNRPGCFDVNASLNGQMCVQRLFVWDTTAPVLALKADASAFINHPVEAETLLSLASDETELTFGYVQEPDWTQGGEQSVIIEAKDMGGNRAQVAGKLAVVPDTTPPQIITTPLHYVYVGQPVSYYAEATVVDDSGETVALTVDNSAVDIYRAGTYWVTYSAVDSAGNASSVATRFVFRKPVVSEEVFQAAVDKAYAAIIDEDMTLGQKAYAIFWWIKGSFSYSHSSQRNDWQYEAYRGLTNRRGGCYTYASVAKSLLEKAGAQAIIVRRSTGITHYWLLVNVGTGWYHFDCLNSGGTRKYECFMRTTAETTSRSPTFWRYDQRLYPATAEGPFERDW